MTDTFTTIGTIATEPRHVVTQEGLPITSFRLAATGRRFNRDARQWENGETNWFTVTAFRQLALNSATSLGKGERVIVSGRLRVRDWDNGERSGTTIEIDATSIGHDLSLGTSSYVRNVRTERSAEGSTGSFDPDEAMAAQPNPGDEWASGPEAEGSESTGAKADGDASDLGVASGDEEARDDEEPAAEDAAAA